MSEAAVDLDRPRRSPSAADRARAFRDAGRHSTRVRLLRRAMVGGAALLVVGVIGWSLFAPTGELPEGVSISAATLNGTRVTMELPKLYEVRARSGVQDVRTPKIIELNAIDATIQTSDGASVRVLAPRGVFDSGADQMRLDAEAAGDGIRITSNAYDIVMRSADMDFKKGHVVSSDPVTVRMTSGFVSADSLEIQGNGSVVSFSGNVRSTIAPDRGVRLDGQDEGKAE